MKELFILWALCSLAGNSLGEKSPVIQEATFWSTNFENIFTWKIKGGIAPGTLYDVQYKKYGDAWQSKPECQNTTQKVCNLTQETDNLTERYYAQVRAVVPDCCVSAWVTSSRFCPREDTYIEKLDVKYTSSVQSIKFVIQPPYTPLRDEDNSPLTVVDIFKQLDIVFHYEITMFCARTQLKWMIMENNEEFEITDLDPNTEYSGTIHLRYSDKISNPHVFRVRTLSDNAWLPYLFAMLMFIIMSTFGTVYYFIYKYVKQHTPQKPTSLDFKGISHFQPLILNVEHVLSPYNSSKMIQPRVYSAEVSHHLQGMPEDQKSNPTTTAYQPQSKMLSFQPPAQLSDELSVDYAPQMKKNSQPRTLRDNPSTLTYGLCIEGASHKANQVIKPDSFVSNGHYKAQRPEKANKELQETRIQQKKGLGVENIRQIQHPPFQEDSKGLPQEPSSLLAQWIPAIVEGRGDSYRKQADVLPPNVEADRNAISGSDSLWLTVQPNNSLSQDDSTGKPPTFNFLSWTDNFLHSNPFGSSDCLVQGSQGLKSKPQFLDIAPDTLDSKQINRPFPSLFRALELKLRWDDEPEENAATF